MANVTPSTRHVVPRWRTFDDALATGELNSAETGTQRKADGDHFLKEKEADWLLNKTLLFATDLVSAAHVLGESDVARSAAVYVLENRLDTSPLACRLATSLLGVSDTSMKLNSAGKIPSATRDAIRGLKRRRRQEPRNAFVWMDLARLYAVLGMKEQARQALRVAVFLAPFDRFIIRGAARFYLHDGDPLEALSILRRNDRTSRDPWLMAGEIAVSEVAARSPKFAKRAEELLKHGSHAPFHLSEARAALASLKLGSGNVRAAKRLFAELKDPTDNALAQAIWAAPEMGQPAHMPTFTKSVPAHASEALALDAQNCGNWEEAFQNAKRWINDEAFSARPIVFASALASSPLGKHEEGVQICRAGLRTNPKHAILTNNMAFSLVESGNPQEAADVLSHVNLDAVDDISKICLTATLGLVRYGLGRTEEGRRLYETAIADAEKAKHTRLAALARVYFARGEFRSGNVAAFEIFEQGKRVLEKQGTARELGICAKVALELTVSEKPIQFVKAPWLQSPPES